VQNAAHQEIEEELRTAIELGPLVGVHSRPEDRVVLIVYRARAIGQPRTTPEAVEVRAFAPGETLGGTRILVDGAGAPRRVRRAQLAPMHRVPLREPAAQDSTRLTRSSRALGPHGAKT
jgi:ADP-ribose pyrophosphatase YjhB (NUDIX family)